MDSAVFLIQCPDRRGLVAAISAFFADRGFNLLHCQQHTDLQTGQFFMRVKLDLGGLSTSRRALEEEFAAMGARYDLRWSAHYSDRVARVAVLVSTAAHCLYDLLLRTKEGELRCEIPLIVSNHPRLEPIADTFRIPFHCLPVTPETKSAQERALGELLERSHVDLVVLARYMQVLSPEFVDAYAGRVINIHHAFLPAFQGAKPYHRAYERGVKMIGATAHYATADLDEGPIIEQDVERVTHEQSPEELSRIGQDVERVVLARAVKAHLEHRIIVSGRRTIVFSTGM
jgi:formyltetrahydrofolate deformylase